MTRVRFRHIFGPELYGRLVWFGRLRWVAVGGLALASLLGRRFDFGAVWPSLFFVASVVAAYNLIFRLVLLRPRKQYTEAHGYLRAIAICQMVLDLSALMVTTHFTGSLQSPLLPFFAFHMAIGTMMIASRWTYLLAGGVSLGGLFLLVMDARGALRFHALAADGHFDVTTASLNFVTLVLALFGIVYLTDSVVSLLKRRSIELYEATQALSERSEELQRLLKAMEDLERRKSHYMRISAHQLRSPLGTIRTVLRVLIKRFVDPATEAGHKLLNDTVGVTDGLLEVINDLLDLAKMREGRNRAPWARNVNLNQLLADLLDSLATDAEERQVTLVPDFKGVAVLDWGVPPDLVHAFENLIYNGIKYSHPGRPFTVALRTENGSAIVRFIDQGIGIPEGYHDQVFLEFVRAPNAKHHADVGTGLGLPIVREVIQAHGGRIEVEASGDGGTTFAIELSPSHQPVELRRLLHAGNGSGYDPDTHRRETPTA